MASFGHCVGQWDYGARQFRKQVGRVCWQCWNSSFSCKMRIFQMPFFRITPQLLLKFSHWWQLLLQPASGCNACGLKKRWLRGLQVKSFFYIDKKQKQWLKRKCHLTLQFAFYPPKILSQRLCLWKLFCGCLKDKICAKHKHKPLTHCIVLPQYVDWKANCKLPFIKD